MEIVSATDDHAYAVARISGARRPPVFLVMDVKSNGVMRTFHTHPQLSGARLAPVHDIEFRARDGALIRGYLGSLLNVNGEPRDQPALVVIAREGAGGAPADYGYDFERQLFAGRNYTVLQVNHRGLGGRGAAFVQAGGEASGQKILEDIIDGVRWAIQQGVADPRRICLYGSGHGARAVLAAAAREPGLFKCVVGMNGAYDPPLIENAGSITADVLLMHQRSDVDFPLEQASRLRASLRDAGKAPDWKVIDRFGSGALTPDQRADIYRDVFRFLDRQLAR